MLAHSLLHGPDIFLSNFEQVLAYSFFKNTSSSQFWKLLYGFLLNYYNVLLFRLMIKPTNISFPSDLSSYNSSLSIFLFLFISPFTQYYLN